jgi:glycosyltransferase involved in cell wall biosynthesis
MQRNKIAIVHPQLGWGGSEAVSLWALAALKDEYDVSLVTAGNVDIQGINEFYGTHLDSSDFSILQAPLPIGIRKTTKFAALRWRFVQRYCQKIAPNFDLMVSGYNPCVFGVKGIQLVADLEALPSILPLSNWKRWWYGKTPLRAAYLKLCDIVSLANQEAWTGNISLANSAWTAELLHRDYGVEAKVLYPPVSSDFPGIPEGEQGKGFVCVGRIIPEKGIESIIEILEGVRRSGHDVHLHVIGDADHSPYARQLRNSCMEHRSDWVFFDGRLNERSKNAVIGKHGFGISGRKGEPFGIAVAEMVEAGGIVFVPDNGGQVEIVDHEDLVYASVPDAIEKIDKVLKDPDIQAMLREHLAKGAERFSVERFKKGIRDVVSEFFQAKYAGQMT